MKVFAVVTLGALLLSGCTLPDFATNSESPIILIITGVNQGNVLDSDLLIGTNDPAGPFGVCPDIVPIRVENKSVNPNLPVADWRADIVIERYEIRYYRSDGRSAEGFDVPYRISGNLAFEVIANEATAFNLEVVRRQAKLEPPLSNIIENGRVVTMFAEITLHGRTNAGKASTATARLQIDFGEYGDTKTACD